MIIHSRTGKSMVVTFPVRKHTPLTAADIIYRHLLSEEHLYESNDI